MTGLIEVLTAVEVLDKAFIGGVVGNLFSSVLESAIVGSGKKLSDLISLGPSGRIRNHDIQRALVAAQSRAADEIAAVCLMEDYDSKKSKKAHILKENILKLMKPGKSPEIKQLWRIRDALRDAINSVEETELKEIDGALAVSLDEASSMVEGAETNYEYWKKSCTKSFIQSLGGRFGSLPAPYKKRLRESWFELFRLAFREELKTNGRAGMAYLLDSFGRIASAIDKTEGQVEAGFEKVSERFGRMDRHLQGLRSILEEVRKLVRDKTEESIDQQKFEQAIDSLSGKYETCMVQLRDHVSTEHRRTRKELRKEHDKTHSGIESLSAATTAADNHTHEELAKIFHEVAPQQKRPVPLDDLLDESRKQHELGNYQKSAELSECAVAQCVSSERARALYLAARKWCWVYETRAFESGASPEFALAKFKKLLEKSIEADLDIERARLLELNLAKVDGTLDELVLAATNLIEVSKNDEFLFEAHIVKAQAISSQGDLDKALSEIDQIVRNELMADDHRYQLHLQVARLFVLADHTVATQEDIDSFIALVLANTEDVFVTNERVNDVHERFVRKSNELQKQKSVVRAENLKEGTFLTPQKPGDEFDDDDVASYMRWAVQVLESGYEFMLKTDVAPKALAEHAFQIGERFAVLGDVGKTLAYLAYGERWLNNLKDNLKEDAEYPWPHIRSWGLANRGRTLCRLCRCASEMPSKEKLIIDAKEAFANAQSITRNNESQFKGSADLFCSELDFWIGKCHSLLGEHVESAKHFAKAQSTIGMATDGYARSIGYPARFREGEAWFCAHEDNKAKEIFADLVHDENAPDDVRAMAKEKLHFLQNAPAGPYIDDQGKLRFGPGGVQAFLVKKDDPD